MTDYWFARRYAINDPRRDVVPISAEGWSAVWSFVGWLVGGFIAAVIVALIGVFLIPYLWIAAPIIYVICVVVGVRIYLGAARDHGDQTHTAADYHSGRVALDGRLAPGQVEAAQHARPAVVLPPEGTYWFARYKPGLPQNAGRGLIPLTWQGRATIFAFVGALILGGLLFLLFGLLDQFLIGVPLFAVLAIAGFAFFLWASIAKTDPTISAYDYLAVRHRAAGQASGDSK